MKKTYGVSGLMEWAAVFRHGKATLHARFTGGSLTGYGVTPAEYTTDNPVAQMIIENSRQFRDGRVRLLRQSVRRGAAASGSLPQGEREGREEREEREKSAASDLTKMEFNDPGLARQYLIDTYGIPSGQVATQKAIRKFGEDHGLNITWK